jgi:hypothetical protein
MAVKSWTAKCRLTEAVEHRNNFLENICKNIHILKARNDLSREKKKKWERDKKILEKNKKNTGSADLVVERNKNKRKTLNKLERGSGKNDESEMFNIRRSIKPGNMAKSD